jgi:hypothetical protein
MGHPAEGPTMIISMNATVCGDMNHGEKNGTRSSAAMSRRGCKPVENQAVTWEDKKLGDWPENGVPLG